MTARLAVRRVALREYLPWSGLILSWVIIALAVGPADAARLFAASAFVRSTRYLTAAGVLTPLRKRISRDGSPSRQAVRVGARVQLVAWLAGLLLLGMVIGLLVVAGQERVAQLCAILAIGLPARYLVPLAAHRRIAYVLGPSLAWSGVLLVALGWLAGAGLTVFALAFAARDWIAYLACLVAAPTIKRDREPLGPLHWREIADHSVTVARRRLAYRIGKGLLSAAFGPFGGAAARTGRGMRVHHRLDRFTPKQPLPIAALAATTSASAVAMIMIGPPPGVLVVAASLLMVAAVAANVLVWSVFVTGKATADDEEDEDEI